MVAKKLSLRERKFARTKLALLNAAIERLEHKPLEAIAVTELCDSAEVSEATFFNYFPRKTDLLVYFVQLWTLELGWRARQAGDGPGLAAITATFKLAAEKIQQHPGLMAEIIAWQARLREKPAVQEIGPAERRLAFPDLAGIDEMPATGLDAILVPNLQHAVKHGQLPPNTHLHGAMVGLIAIFYGVPLVLGRSNPEGVRSMYLQQLSMLWAGIRGVSTANPTPTA